MKNIWTAVLFFSVLTTQAQPPVPTSDPEKMLASLKQAGYVKQEGNHIIFKVQKASDTVQTNKMYGALFKSPTYTIGYDVDASYFEKKNAKPTKKSASKEARNAATLELLKPQKPVKKIKSYNLKSYSSMDCGIPIFRKAGRTVSWVRAILSGSAR